jgi:hypothetical protein
MSRALRRSVAHAPPTTQPGLARRLRRWLAGELPRLRPAIARSAARCGADRYRKHFDAVAHAVLLIFHGLRRSESLRQSYAAFAGCRALVALSGLGVSTNPDTERLAISFSQVAASTHSRPAAFLVEVVGELMARVRQAGRGRDLPYPVDLHAIDSTFLRVSLRLAPWLPTATRTEQPGVRLQVQYTPALDLPTFLCLTTTHRNDCQGIDAGLLDQPERLAALRDHTLALDLGYYSHARFARLRNAGVHFVSRLHPQATVGDVLDLEVQVPLPLPDLPTGRITVLADRRATIGSPKNKRSAVLPGLRLVEAAVLPLPAAARRGATPVTYQLLTDRWDVTALEVVQLYLWRWQIELFFRWLKHFLHLPRLLGYSENAVLLTVWLAIITHLLTLLASLALGFVRRGPTVLGLFPDVLAQLTPDEVTVDDTGACQPAFCFATLNPDPPPAG